jgi:hypothetical protein
VDCVRVPQFWAVCEKVNNYLGPVSCESFLDQLSDYQFLKEDKPLWD